MTHYRIIDHLEVNGEELLSLIGSLPSWRREDALRFRFDGGRRECALSYQLLCSMLQEHFGIAEQPAFALGEHGKPSLVLGESCPDIHFNLSHCKHAIACAVSDECEVGIDVECLGRYKPSLAQYCMSDEELRSISEAADSDLIFTRLWTQKEALLKYTGEGITDDIKTVLTSPRADNVSFETTEDMVKGYVCTMVKNRS